MDKSTLFACSARPTDLVDQRIRNTVPTGTLRVIHESGWKWSSLAVCEETYLVLDHGSMLTRYVSSQTPHHAYFREWEYRKNSDNNGGDTAVSVAIQQALLSGVQLAECCVLHVQTGPNQLGFACLGPGKKDKHFPQVSGFTHKGI